MTCHWKDCPHGDDCVHAQRSGTALASIASAIAMATEYQAWIDFYHSGDGDYADFMRRRCPHCRVDLTGTQGHFCEGFPADPIPATPIGE